MSDQRVSGSSAAAQAGLLRYLGICSPAALVPQVAGLKNKLQQEKNRVNEKEAELNAKDDDLTEGGC